MALLRHKALHRVCGGTFDGLAADREEGDDNGGDAADRENSTRRWLRSSPIIATIFAWRTRQGAGYASGDGYESNKVRGEHAVDGGYGGA